jgi:hypothetical protein
MERVRELYLRHNLERLAKKVDEEFVYIVIHTGKKRVPRDEQMIFSILNAHYFVDVISFNSFDARTGESMQAYEVLGTSRNVRMAEYVYHFLTNNLPLLWRHYQQQTGKAGRLRRSYNIGVLRGFDDKLNLQKTAAATSAVEQGVAAGLIPFGASAHSYLKLAERQLRAFVRYRHPKILSKSARATTIDRDTYDAGRRDGARLTVHRPVSSSHSGPMRYLGS